MINLLSLSYFVTVAMEQNMTKAAHKLHISQQALSFHIAKVEDYYGTPLLTGSRSSTSPMPARSACATPRRFYRTASV